MKPNTKQEISYIHDDRSEHMHDCLYSESSKVVSFSTNSTLHFTTIFHSTQQIPIPPNSLLFSCPVKTRRYQLTYFNGFRDITVTRRMTPKLPSRTYTIFFPTAKKQSEKILGKCTTRFECSLHWFTK